MNRCLVLLPVLVAFLVGAAPATAWTWPVGGPVLQQFQLGDDPYAGGQHRGIDVGGISGMPVLAPAAGTVTFAGTVPGGGRTVTIETPDGYAVTLLHLGSAAVARGTSLLEGEAVGTLGQSGDMEHAEPYVHLGVRLAADPHGYLDPLAFLPPQVESPTSDPGSAEPGAGSTGSPAGEVVGAPETSGGQAEAPAGPTGAQADPTGNSADPTGNSAEPVGVPASASAAQPVAASASTVPSPPAAQPPTGPGASGVDEPPVPATAAAPAVPNTPSPPPPAEANHQPGPADGSGAAAPATPLAVDSSALPAAPSVNALASSAGWGPAQRAAAAGKPRSPARDAHRGRDRGRSHDGDHAGRARATGDARVLRAGGSQRALAATALPDIVSTRDQGGGLGLQLSVVAGLGALALLALWRRPGLAVPAQRPPSSPEAGSGTSLRGSPDPVGVVRASVRLESPDGLARSA
jgi:hypothetical protein